MQQSKAAYYLHFVWATDQRLPLLNAMAERIAWRSLSQEAMRLNARVVALNGTDDHIHLLVAMPTAISAGRFMNQLKGVSSHHLNALQTLHFHGAFRWQEGYGVFSVSPGDVGRIIQYIRNQKLHHAGGTTYPLWEPIELTPQCPIDTRHPPGGRMAEGHSAGAFTPR